MSLIKRWLGLEPEERERDPLVCPRCRAIDTFVLLATRCRAYVGEKVPTLYPRSLKIACDGCGTVLIMHPNRIETVRLEREPDPPPGKKEVSDAPDSDLAVPAAERGWRRPKPTMEDAVL